MAKQKITRKEDQRLCKHDLTTEERLAYGNEMADAESERNNLDAQLGFMKKEYQAKIDAKTARIGTLSGIIRAGYEERMTDCEVVSNYTTGFVTVVRKDTGEVIHTRRMSEQERQLPIDVKDEEAEPAGAGKK